jgi:hypothetical protein
MVSATSIPSPQLREYSDEERARLFAAFQPELARHRARLRKLRGWLAVCIACFIIIVLVQHTFAVWFVGFAAIFSVTGLARRVWKTIDGPVCPGCGEHQYLSLGDFCPHCGGADVDMRPKWFERPHCRSCGTILAFGKHVPKFRRRFCARCGLKLDDEGF